jgi:16S rRNA processing protein RimM
MRRVWLATGAAPRQVAVLSCRLHRGQAIFQFEGVGTIAEAERLRGAEIQVLFSERRPLPPDRYYLSDLAGCAVWEEGATAPLGTVREVQFTGANGAGGASAVEAWVLAVDAAEGELLIPLAAEICIRIDTASRRIDVRLPEGLRQLNRQS